MTLDEALEWGEVISGDDDLAPCDKALPILAAEVRRLQAEVTALRLYAPAQRAGSMRPPVQIAPTNWAFWMNETDEEFKAWGNAHTEASDGMQAMAEALKYVD